MAELGRKPRLPVGVPCRVLAVTDDIVLCDGASGHDPGRGRHVHGISEVTGRLLARVAPSLVVAPLMARDFDAADLVLRLAALDYPGRVVLLSDVALAPHHLTAELRALAPQLWIEVLELPGRERAG